MIDPIIQLKKRVAADKCESETSLFYSLMFYGEAIFKIIILAFAASIKDDPSRSRYSLEYLIVRSDGIGDWNAALNTIRELNPLMNEAARLDFSEITKKCASNEWQYKAVLKLQECVSIALEKEEKGNAGKESLISWFNYFVQLRNKTRAHGAITIQKIEKIIAPLEESINLLADNISIFGREWAYLKRTIQGKYRVTRISETDNNFSYLKTRKALDIREEYFEGVYVFLGKPILISLIRPLDPNISDFYLPNGGWNNKTYELISYTTDSRQQADAGPYLKSAKDLPISETQACGELDVICNVFTNMPSRRKGYVKRAALESELLSTLLMEDTRPIVTLVGKGGIGKTWLTLEVLHIIAESTRYQSIIWFSSRDIDLMESGYKLVKPHLLTIEDIATEYSKLVSFDIELQKQNSHMKITRLANDLSLPNESIGPSLFVFDNFETLEDPVSIYSWIEQHIRHPNKVIITTRNRNFKADYPLHIKGLEMDEYNELIQVVMKRNGYYLEQILIDKIYERSEGHPYIIRLVLSEIMASKRKNPDAILAGRMDVLEILFERTYQILSSESQRLFLTLCNWDSCVSLIALTATMISNNEAPLDTDTAIEELVNTSFVDIVESAKDKSFYVSVPLAAMLFGRKKIATSGYLMDIKADSSILQKFGVIKETSIDNNFEYYFLRFLSSYSDQQNNSGIFDDRIWSVIDNILIEKNDLRLVLCRFLSDVSEKSNDHKDVILIQLKQFLQNCKELSKTSLAWKWILQIQKFNEENTGEIISTIAAIANIEGISYELLSECANHLNFLRQQIDQAEQRLYDFARNQLIDALLKRSSEANATDYSRIAWLLNSMGKLEEARDNARKGLEMDKNNIYCARYLDGIKHW